MMARKIIPWAVFLIFLGLIILGFALKENMNTYLSKKLIAQAGPDIINTEASFVDSVFNYSKNRQSYQLTFLEFGAKGCSACKRMESVMEEVSNKYPQKVKVVFMNILVPENQNLMKYFGIASIPTELLLDKNGKEWFRHSGYYSFHELSIQFKKAGI